MFMKSKLTAAETFGPTKLKIIAQELPSIELICSRSTRELNFLGMELTSAAAAVFFDAGAEIWLQNLMPTPQPCL